MKSCLVFLFFLILILSACKKDSNREYCWQRVDAMGNEMGTVCGKTEAEMKAMDPNSCSYFKKEGDAFCWMINNQVFVKDKTEAYMQHYSRCYGGATYVKVNCDYCKNFYTRQKRTYKPNNTTTYSNITYRQYCGDTATTLYHGREIIIKDTPDSLILVQFSNSGIF
jgi:hypothetical protein